MLFHCMVMIDCPQLDLVFFGFPSAKVVDSTWYSVLFTTLVKPILDDGVKTLQTTDWSEKIVTSATQNFLRNINFE